MAEYCKKKSTRVNVSRVGREETEIRRDQSESLTCALRRGERKGAPAGNEI